jgi:hypothetical protein
MSAISISIKLSNQRWPQFVSATPNFTNFQFKSNHPTSFVYLIGTSWKLEPTVGSPNHPGGKLKISLTNIKITNPNKNKDNPALHRLTLSSESSCLAIFHL